MAMQIGLVVVVVFFFTEKKREFCYISFILKSEQMQKLALQLA